MKHCEKAHESVHLASMEICAPSAFQRHRVEGLLLECSAQTEQLFEVCTLWTSSIRNRCVGVCVCVCVSTRSYTPGVVAEQA